MVEQVPGNRHARRREEGRVGIARQRGGDAIGIAPEGMFDLGLVQGQRGIIAG